MSFAPEERRAYCANEHVRARISEFFGEAVHDERPAVYLAVGTENGSRHREALAVEELPSWMDRGVELNRSFWDRASLICHLDIEYVNFDDPGYPFLHEARVFALQAPVIAAAEEVLAECGIHPMKLMTGRGYHLVWSIERGSRACAELAALGHVSASLKRLYSIERAPTGEQVTPELGAAFAGLGLVMEYVASEVKARAAPLCEVPVQPGAIESGGGPHGREMISLDITEYADPLCSRVMRAPFSVYLKPDQQRLGLGEGLTDGIAPLVVIPLGDLAVAEALAVRHDPAAAALLAETSWGNIPDESRAMKRLIKAYRGSALANFHAEFYAQEHDAPALWPETYDRLPPDVLPPCTRVILENPNDLLLRPGCAQRVVRVMLSLGWHPRHIAGLIRSKYERNHAWGDQWRGYDPATRADFYARVFSGLVITGVDDCIDFNCKSAREEGICFVEHCSENLLRFRSSLLDRRHHERLACRPFNRLFSLEEHL
jgi:hypothetical protein